MAIAGAAFDIIAGGAKNCFVGGTEVLTGSLDDGQATFSDKNIEDIHVGDQVWTKDQDNPDAPLELKTVTNVFSHQAYDLQKVSLTDAQGNTEVIESTDEHPYYVDGQGWTGAGDLHIGDRVVSSDGQVLVVSGNVDDKPACGITVYNFTVEGDHTYFVSQYGEDWAWVHNTCISENAVAGRAREGRMLDELRAAHPDAIIQRERYLRDAAGNILRDESNSARRIDFAVIEGGKVIRRVEVTAMNVNKSAQVLKESNIRSLGRVFIRDRVTRQYLEVTDIITEIKYRP